MTKVSASRNKARGAQDERDFAKLLGAKRHWADTGGPEDLEHEWMSIQIRGGLRVVNETIRDGLAKAKISAGTKLPVLGLVDRAGGRIRRYVVIEASDFAAWNGLPGAGSGD